jgi:hypothetical protein
MLPPRGRGWPAAARWRLQALALALAAQGLCAAQRGLAHGAAHEPGQEPKPAGLAAARDVDCDFAASYPEQYVARRVRRGAVRVDGALDEAAWSLAPWGSDFVEIAGRGPAPRLRTRAKLLWDEQFLYVAAELAEPTAWANISSTCHCNASGAPDQVIFHDNDFEVFVDPAGSCANYKELEINALGADWNLLLDRPYADGGLENSSRLLGAAGFDLVRYGLRSAARVYGAVNDPARASAQDRWTVEIALPLAGLMYGQPDARDPRVASRGRRETSESRGRGASSTSTSSTSSNFSSSSRTSYSISSTSTSTSNSSRASTSTGSNTSSGGSITTTTSDGDGPVLWRINFSRVEWRVHAEGGRYVKDAPDEAEDNWVWSAQHQVNMHLPERWGVLQFANGDADAQHQRDRSWSVRQVAMTLYYAQVRHRQDTGAFTDDLASLAARAGPWPTQDGRVLEGACSLGAPRIALSTARDAYLATVLSRDGRFEATVDNHRALHARATPPRRGPPSRR